MKRRRLRLLREFAKAQEEADRARGEFLSYERTMLAAWGLMIRAKCALEYYDTTESE